MLSISLILIAVGVYFILGFLFALPYLLISGKGRPWADQLDPTLASSSLRVRLLLVTGTVAAWPVLAVNRFTQRSSS